MLAQPLADRSNGALDEPSLPRALDDRQLKRLAEVNASLEKRLSECFPEIAAWRAKYGKR
jgi:hypothetical protein